MILRVTFVHEPDSLVVNELDGVPEGLEDVVDLVLVDEGPCVSENERFGLQVDHLLQRLDGDQRVSRLPAAGEGEQQRKRPVDGFTGEKGLVSGPPNGHVFIVSPRRRDQFQSQVVVANRDFSLILNESDFGEIRFDSPNIDVSRLPSRPTPASGSIILGEKLAFEPGSPPNEETVLVQGLRGLFRGFVHEDSHVWGRALYALFQATYIETFQESGY